VNRGGAGEIGFLLSLPPGRGCNRLSFGANPIFSLETRDEISGLEKYFRFLLTGLINVYMII
jgi:hypothetical protein